MEKLFVCLANSYKRGGRCVAGVEVVYDEPEGWSVVWNYDGTPCWVRPVSHTAYGEIPNSLAEGVRLLSIVKLTDVEPCPHGVHGEDVYFGHLECLSDSFPLRCDALNQFVDHAHTKLFGNNCKAIPADGTGDGRSLTMIRVGSAEPYQDTSRENVKTRLRFTYNGVECDFPVTDPIFLDEYRRNSSQFQRLGNVYLTLSLGLEYEGWHHKLVAAISIPEDNGETEMLPEVENTYMYQQKLLHENAYARWTEQDDQRLVELFQGGETVQNLTQIFGRNEGAIRSRIKKILGDEALKHEQAVEDDDEQTATWLVEDEKELARLLMLKGVIEERIEAIRSHIRQQMEEQSLQRVESREFTITYTPPRVVMQFDTKSFKQANVDLYNSYCVAKQRDGMIVIKRRKTD